MLNRQSPWAKNADLARVLVHSVFYTIQGEGPFAGRPAVFVRLAGCNLQCPMCDTDYTSKVRVYDPKVLALYVCRTAPNYPLVVITGGEPFRQAGLRPFVEHLVWLGYDVQLETNGTLYQHLPWDQITTVCSPKTGRVHPMLAEHISAFKYVANADQLGEDGLPDIALDHPNPGRLARPHKGFEGKIYLQPIDVGDPVENKRHLDACVKSCMEFGYYLCLQQHKIIGVE